WVSFRNRHHEEHESPRTKAIEPEGLRDTSCPSWFMHFAGRIVKLRIPREPDDSVKLGHPANRAVVDRKDRPKRFAGRSTFVLSRCWSAGISPPAAGRFVQGLSPGTQLQGDLLHVGCRFGSIRNLLVSLRFHRSIGQSR